MLPRLGERRTVVLATVVFAIGVAARLLAARRGHNFDIESYRLVGEILDNGGSVYAETDRYNYGPVWMLVIRPIYALTIGAGSTVPTFHLAIAGVLTVVDIALAAVLYRRFDDPMATVLFFLNPVSILITGYHSQFDNLAVLVGLLGVRLVVDTDDEPGLTKRELKGLVLLGLSLAVKHLLIVFPLWIALRKPDLRSRILAATVPLAVFVTAFVPYWPRAGYDIVVHVAGYRWAPRMPLLKTIALGHTLPRTVAAAVFLGTLVAAGLLLRRRVALDHALLLYLVLAVVVSPTMANQYLAVPAVAIAVLWNPLFALYSGWATLYLLTDIDGLHLAWMPSFFGRNGDRTLKALVVVLALGLVLHATRWRRATREVGLEQAQGLSASTAGQSTPPPGTAIRNTCVSPNERSGS